VLILTSCGKNEPEVIENPPQEQIEAPVVVDPEPDPEPTPEPEPVSTFDIETDRHDAIYNHNLIKAIYLGMTRTELENSFAPLDESQHGYIPYDDHNFFIEYWGNDTVKVIIIYERDIWETFNGITYGSAAAQIIASYGEPLAIEDGLYSYYTYKNEILSEAPSLAEVDVNYLYSIGFIIADDIVQGITLNRF